MNPVRKVFFVLIHIVTAVLLGIALFFAVRIGLGYGLADVGIQEADQMKIQIAQNFDFTYGALWLLCAMILLLLIFILIPGSWLDHASKKGRIVFFLILTACLLGIQLYLAFGLNIIQNTDSFEVQDQALAIVQGLQKTVDYTKSSYFRKYGNNDLYLAFCILLYRICRAWHIADWRKFFVLWNMLSIDLGIFMVCRIIRLIKGPAAGLKAYFLCVLNPLNYLLLHWTYTCTFSAPLMMLSVYAAVIVRKKRDGTVPRILAAAVIGITAALGYSMRPTATFPVIALILYLVLFGIPKVNAGKRTGRNPGTKWQRENAPLPDNGPADRRKEHKKAGRKRRMTAAAAVLTAAVCAALTFGAARNLSRTYNPDQRYQFPLEHWIMIGITGTGRVTGEDIHYTQNFPTAAEKKAADRDVIKAAFEERGMAGTLKFYLEKIGLTWSEGTGEYYQRTTESENSRQLLYQMTSGEDSGATILYCQAYRIVLLGMAILGILRNLWHRQSGFFTVSTVTVLGGLVFYMVWEGKPVYSFPFLYYLVLLGCNAWNPMTRRYTAYAKGQNRWMRHLRAAAVGMILLMTGISIWFRSYAVSHRPYYTDPSIVCDNGSLTTWQSLHGTENMIQEFYPAYAFNHIRIRARRAASGSGEMLVQLKAGQKVLKEKHVTAQNVRNGFLYLTFSEVQPRKNQKFTLLFQPLSGGKAPVEIGTRLCYVTSEYKGRRLLNGTERAGDTLLKVYQRDLLPE